MNREEQLTDIVRKVENGQMDSTVAFDRILRLFDVSGLLPLDRVDQLLEMQIEECRYFAQRCARDKGMACAEYDKWIAETPVLKLHRQLPIP